jgi:pimeloyl-ACP methyl ester carboxylesterase
MITTLIALALPVIAVAQRGRPPAVLTTSTFLIGDSTLAVDEGSFTVPAQRGTDSSRVLTLRFVRFSSTATTPAAPIVFLAGGPGDAATRAFRGMPLDFLNQLRALADVIAFDQRGTGTSEPLNALCPPAAVWPLHRAADPVQVVDSVRARVRRCLDSATQRGIVVAGLTTEESADDLEALRYALGAPKLSFLAGSYGTHLALTAARRHPQLVERMVLAGVEGPDDTFKLPARIDSVLATIAATRRPSLLDDIRTLRTRLAAEPARMPTPTGETLVVGEWDLQRWISDALDTTREIEALLAALPGMLAGDFTVLARWAWGYRQPRALNLMNLAMDCASYVSASRLREIHATAASALLGNAINFPLTDSCAVPGLPRLTDEFRRPVQSNVPALLISGTFDGRTPVENAKAVSRGMPNARLLVIEGASHGLFSEPEALRALLAFLREPL